MYYILNISQVPLHVIEAIDQSLKHVKTMTGREVRVEASDNVRGTFCSLSIEYGSKKK